MYIGLPALQLHHGLLEAPLGGNREFPARTHAGIVQSRTRARACKAHANLVNGVHNKQNRCEPQFFTRGCQLWVAHAKHFQTWKRYRDQQVSGKRRFWNP